MPIKVFGSAVTKQNAHCAKTASVFNQGLTIQGNKLENMEVSTAGEKKVSFVTEEGTTLNAQYAFLFVRWSKQ